jgi:hypothetical protein
MPKHANVVKNETVGLLGTFIVAMATLDRLSTLTSSLSTVPLIFFSSFLKGLSQTAEPTAVLDPSTLEKAETKAAKSSVVLEQMQKDFDKARESHTELLKKDLAQLDTGKIDQYEAFLELPGKETMALNRSARALLANRSNKSVKALDELWINSSAATTVVLVSSCRLGENLGKLVGSKLKFLKKSLAVPIQLYFVAHFLNEHVINSPAGKLLRLPELTKAAQKLLKLVKDKLILKGGVLDKIKEVLDKTTSAFKFLNNPVTKELIGKTTGVLKKLGLRGAGLAVGGFVGSAVISVLLATKTYVLAPLLAGVLDGLIEPDPSQNTLKELAEARSQVSEADTNYFVSLFTSMRDDLSIAYKAALKKYACYDEYLDQTPKQEKATEVASPEGVEAPKKDSPLVSVLLKGNLAGGKIDELLGRSVALTKGSKRVVHTTDKARAAMDAASSYVAAKSYQVGRGLIRAPRKVVAKVKQLKNGRGRH